MCVRTSLPDDEKPTLLVSLLSSKHWITSGMPMIVQILQTATTTMSPATLSLGDAWSFALQLGSISGLILIALRIVEMIFRRVRLEVSFSTYRDLTDKGKPVIDATITVRNKGQRSTSIETMYFQWSDFEDGMFRRRPLVNAKMMVAPVVEIEPGLSIYKSRKREPVSLPLRILGGETRALHTSIVCDLGTLEVAGREAIPRECLLVMETTHHKYVEKLDPSHFQRVRH